MAPSARSPILLSIVGLGASIALGVAYLAVTGHLVPGVLDPKPLVGSLGAAFAGVSAAWTILFIRHSRSLSARLGGAEQTRARLLALPPRAAAGLGAGWLFATAFIIVAYAQAGLDRVSIELLVVSLVLGPAVIGSAACGFLVEDWARRHAAALPGGGSARGGLSLRMRLFCVISGLSLIPGAAVALTCHLRAVRLEAELARARVVIPLAIGPQRGAWLLLLATGAVVAVIAMLAVRSFVVPLSQLVEGMNRVRAGDSAVRLAVISRDDFGRATEEFNAMLDATEQHRRIEENFGRYLSPEVAEAIRANRIPVTGEVKRVTLLFADIRNFTSIAETMAPAALLDFVNTYMDAMIDAATPHRGRVDKVMGDGLMLVFGAPMADSQHAANGVRAALAMREALVVLNAARSASGLPQVRIGIGVHTGEVVAGNVGCQMHKLEYAVLGDAVNLASRIEGLTKEAGTDLLISEDTVREAGPAFEFLPVGEMPVRGRVGAVRTFTVPDAKARGSVTQ